MSPMTHLLASWSVAGTANLSTRERALVTIAGIAPDIDGAGLILDMLNRNGSEHLELWEKYHHVLGHNIGFGLLLAIAALALSTRRRPVCVLVLVSFHLHLLCDLLGSKGPEGYQWPIPYLLPFSNVWQWQWAGQWQLNAWPNFAITSLLIGYGLFLAWRKQASPLQFISSRMHDGLVQTLQKRFGLPKRAPL